jgi:hypothetical protein
MAILLNGFCELPHPQNPASERRKRALDDRGHGFFMKDAG